MPSVSEYAATGPVAPLLPQLPHVSQGASSIWLITVVVVFDGVGEGLGEGTGVGAGVWFAVVEVGAIFPPQEARANVNASITRQERAIRQNRKAFLLKKDLVSTVGGECTRQWAILDYVEDLRQQLPKGVDDGQTGEWPLVLIVHWQLARHRAIRRGTSIF